MRLIKSATLCSLTALALAACGGSGNDAGGSATEQSKQLTRLTKAASATYQTAVESLYVAYFGRPADPNGLANFSAALQAAGAPTTVAGLAQAYAGNTSVKNLIDSFGTSTESKNLYGNGATTAFVTAVFQNVLGRAPQSAGLSFWVSAIDSGSVSQGDAALSIMAGALANTSTQGLIDAQLVNNRLAAAGYFTGAASASTYTGAAAAANARAMLATINATTAASVLQSTAVTDAQAINNQTVFESTALHGGEWYIFDNIPYGGGTLITGQNYVYGEVVNALAASPSIAPQQATPYFTTLATALQAPTDGGASRVLLNGQVLLHPTLGLRSVSYAGSGVQVNYFDSTGKTIVSTSQFDNYQAVSLSGQMSASSQELMSAVPINQWIAYANFATTAAWQSGSGYIKHQGHAVGDQYSLDDCASANPTYTSGTTPTPCTTGGSLASIFPITLYGGGSNYPSETDFAGDGTYATVQGLSMWIANSPSPAGENGVASYRIFVQMSGKVYMGSLIKDGSPYYYGQADGSTVNYILALNQTAANSVSKGLITGSGGGSKTGFGSTVGNMPDLFGIGGTGINGSLSPADLRAHYNVPAALTGAGQTIAIIDGPSSYDIEADLAAYSTYFNLPACTTANGCYKHVDQSNGAAVSSSEDWGGEPDLDVQMVHAVAPGAKIILITAPSGSGADLFAAVQYAYTLPGVTAVSMSFGAGGFDPKTDSTFRTAAQNGGAIAFASSGDAAYQGNSPNFPSSSLWAIAVGGTRINNVDWTSPASESGWQFSGGGTAVGITPTTWMSQIQSQAQLTGARGVPDVGAVADFQNSAVTTYSADQWGLSGGTSASAPLWAGFAALLGESVGANNQSLLQKLGSPQGGFGQVIYQMAASSSAATLFYRPASGSNNLSADPCSLCVASGTYNEVTGVGAPNVANMVTYLGGSVTAIESNPKLGTPAYKMLRRSLKVKALPLHLRPVAPQGN